MKNNKMISMVVNNELLEQFDDLAKRSFTTRSGLLKQLMTEAVKQDKDIDNMYQERKNEGYL